MKAHEDPKQDLLMLLSCGYSLCYLVSELEVIRNFNLLINAALTIFNTIFKVF